MHIGASNRLIPTFIGAPKADLTSRPQNSQLEKHDEQLKNTQGIIQKMGSIVTRPNTRRTTCSTSDEDIMDKSMETLNSKYSGTSDEPTFQAFKATVKGQAELSIIGDPEWPHNWIENKISIKAEAVTAFLATLGVITLAIVGILSVRASKRRRQQHQQ